MWCFQILQKESPRLPREWYPLSSREAKTQERQKNQIKKVEKGAQRWKDLPDPLDVNILHLFFEDMYTVKFMLVGV